MKTTSVVGIVLAGVAMASAAPLTESQYQSLFTRFVSMYDKKYETSSFFAKYNTFKANLDLILEHNKNPNETYTLGMNQFGDMTQEEFSKFMGLKNLPFNMDAYKGTPLPAVFEDNTHLASKTAASFDWNSHLPPVQNQGSCGSCWAFSATGGLEGIISIKTGKKVKLSEQQLVDCDKQSQGCSGGLMSWSYEYIKKAGGQCLLSTYPYHARQMACQAKGCLPVANVSSYSQPINSDAVLSRALKQQPIPITLAASSSAFQFYRSGVVTGSSCSQSQLVNHAVIAVGAGVENGIDYYLIRNSWGASWGDKGHIKLAQGQNNKYAPASGVCGIFGRGDWNCYPIL